VSDSCVLPSDLTLLSVLDSLNATPVISEHVAINPCEVVICQNPDDACKSKFYVCWVGGVGYICLVLPIATFYIPSFHALCVISSFIAAIQ
jgi:hypothetical protein